MTLCKQFIMTRILSAQQVATWDTQSMLFHHSITGEQCWWQQGWKLSINTSSLLARKAGMFCCVIHTCKEQPVPLFPSAGCDRIKPVFPHSAHFQPLLILTWLIPCFQFINSLMNYDPPEEVSYLMQHLRLFQDYDFSSKIFLMLLRKIIMQISMWLCFTWTIS